MLMAKEIISLIFLCSHTHTNYLFQRQQYFVLSSLAIFSKVATLCSLFLGYLLEGGKTLLSPSSCVPPKRKSFFLSLSFTFYFPFLQREDPWAKTIKFFVALSIYKTLLLFPLGLRIHYIFNKE